MKRSRPAIALLITLFFIMAISVAVGVSLTQFQEGRKTVDRSAFLVQSSAVVEDVLELLKTAPMVKQVEDTASLAMFIESSRMIPLEADGLQTVVSVKSARDRFNINTLPSSKPFQEAFGRYLLRYNVQDISYLQDLLLDCMGGEQPSYRTEIMEEMPWLYRERIADMAHLKQILDFYVQKRYDNSVNEVPWKRLVRFSEHASDEIDPNYLSTEGWHLMLPDIMPEKVGVLTGHPDLYENLDDLGLSEAEAQEAKRFSISYYAPVVEVKIEIATEEQQAKIELEYAIDTKQVRVLKYDI